MYTHTYRHTLFCNIDTAAFAPRASALGSTTETHFIASALCFFSLALDLAWEVAPIPALSCIASVAFDSFQSAFFLKQYRCSPAKPTHESRVFLFLAILFLLQVSRPGMRAAGLLEEAFSDGYFVVDEPKFKGVVKLRCGHAWG